MKTFLNRLAFLGVAAHCISLSLALPAAADSTADLVLNLKCQEGSDVQVWRNRTNGQLMYRSESPLGNVSLNGGTVRATEGVRVYEFQNGIYRYAVWDGTLDSLEAGSLEVYQNNFIVLQEPCAKI